MSKTRRAIADFEQRLGPKWRPQLAEKLADYERTGILQFKPKRFLLTVAHLDQDPSNNSPDNLKALCAPCHLRFDARFRGSNRMRKLERKGQLNLFATYPGGEQA
ncbi:MAG: HNH endonuclease [Acaryochloridaceae cyanobacterium RU_4_10]|nr:HNH endonuclease [Acaryochloridaceae cyanobacterium RU_4_10]